MRSVDLFGVTRARSRFERIQKKARLYICTLLLNSTI